MILTKSIILENYILKENAILLIEKEDTFVAPDSVAKEAQQAIDAKEKYGDKVKGGTQVGWTRARQLANKENISIDTIKRMVAFFSRHEGNQKVEDKDFPWSDNGYTAWKIWGGDSGKEWANKVLDKYNKMEERTLPELLYEGKLYEWTLETLKSKDSISDFTMKFRKDRNKLMGTENTTAKLVDCFVNEIDNSITFVWKTKATDYKSDKAKSLGIYKDKDKKARVSPLNLQLLPNDENQYEVQLKILKFFDWLDTTPVGNEITNKDIKDILEVSDVQVFSSSPSFQYQAYNWNNSQVGTAIYPTDIAPKVWNKYNDNAFLDKHLYGIIRNIDFWLNPMASMLTKRLKDKEII